MNRSNQKINEQAARWFARMQNASPDHPDRGRFEAWLMGHHTHAEAYASLSSIWSKFEQKDGIKSVAAAITSATTMTQLQKRKDREQLVKGIVTILILALGAISGLRYWQAQPLMQMASSTSVGRMVTRHLDDGSELMLNSNTQIEVAYYRDRRTVKLIKGEVIFDVARDEQRPFSIDSGYAKVTVLGTRFVVNKLDRLVRISVNHGKVRVESQSQDGSVFDKQITLTNGQVGEVVPKQAPHRVDRNAEDAFGFARGTIVFEQADMEEVAEVLSRYRQKQIAFLPSNRNPKITALVQIRTINTFLDVLPRIAPVNVTENESETLITSK